MRIGRLPEAAASGQRVARVGNTRRLAASGVENNDSQQRCAHVHPIPTHSLLHASAQRLAPALCPDLCAALLKRILCLRPDAARAAANSASALLATLTLSTPHRTSSPHHAGPRLRRPARNQREHVSRTRSTAPTTSIPAPELPLTALRWPAIARRSRPRPPVPPPTRQRTHLPVCARTFPERRLRIHRRTLRLPRPPIAPATSRHTAPTLAACNLSTGRSIDLKSRVLHRRFR